jgi:hypothetical protein
MLDTNIPITQELLLSIAEIDEVIQGAWASDDSIDRASHRREPQHDQGSAQATNR